MVRCIGALPQIMREKTVEEYFVRRVEELGGMCMKFISPGLSGVPDRLVLYRGLACFVELKAPGKSPRKLQRYVHRQIRKQGIPVFTADTKEAADRVISFLQNRKEVVPDEIPAS